LEGFPEKLLGILPAARRVTVLTGAGVSAESGVPTFRQAQPNPAHSALAEMELRVPSFTLITQNVDGLHQRAGSQNVLELHGNIFRSKCFQACDLFFSIGTSAIVHPAASLPHLALENHIPVIEMNPDLTPLSSLATYHLNGRAGALLPALVKAAWG
jgi:NAD-dependent deacetylase